MAVSKTTIISNAITILGHKPIITLDNPDDLVVAAEQAYDMLLPFVLSSNNWRFATTITQLTQLNTVPPPNTWAVIFEQPAGFLKNLRIWPQSYQYDFYAPNLIYSNWSGNTPVYMEYVFQPAENTFPAHFVAYFVQEIVQYLALSNANKPEFYDKIKAESIRMMGIAAAIEAQNRPQFSQVNFPTISMRNFTEFSGNVTSA